jgi:hypothetical protein
MEKMGCAVHLGSVKNISAQELSKKIEKTFYNSALIKKS